MCKFMLKIIATILIFMSANVCLAYVAILSFTSLQKKRNFEITNDINGTG